MSRAGMTLLELLVGLTITGLAVTAGFGAVAAIGDRRAHADLAMSAVARAAAQRDAIIGWLSGARIPADEGGPGFRGMDGVRGRVRRDEVSFLTTAPTPLGTGETLVRLYLDDDSTTLERGLTASFAEWQGLRSARLEIEPHASSMDVRYLTRILTNPGWQPSWISSTLLPAAIEIRLGAAAGDSLPPFLALPILVPLRGGH